MTDSPWRGRVDVEDGAAGRRWHEVVRPMAGGARPGLVLLGFASDEGVRRNRGRPGAAEGPTALRGALAGLAYSSAAGLPIHDAGDVAVADGDLEGAQAALGVRVAELLDAGHFPLLLGGGHEIAWGSFQGVARHFDDDGRFEGYGALNIDAHFDLRLPPAGAAGSSGTPFRQIHGARSERGLPFHYLCAGISPASNTPALFAAANELGGRYLLDSELTWPRWAEACAVLDAFVDRCRLLQLSVCLDAFPAHAAPGVSAPAARGVAPDVLFAIISRVVERAGLAPAGGRIVLAEIAELSPPHDRDGMTARLAARVAHDIAGALG